MTRRSDPDRRADEYEPAGIDRSEAHAARLQDYVLGGRANFAVDRSAVEAVTSGHPGCVEALRAPALSIRSFAARVTDWLVTEGTVRQVLVIGAGLPRGDDNVHAVGQRAVPDTRVVYVDDDPIVLAHAHQFRRGTPEGSSTFVPADLREPTKILQQAASTIDLDAPTALLLVGVLHFMSDDENPYGLVAQLVDAVAPGSFLAVCHLASDIRPAATGPVLDRLNTMTRETWTARSRAEVGRFFGGLELVDPGVVAADRWQLPDDAHGDKSSSDDTPPVWVGLAHKPQPTAPG